MSFKNDFSEKRPMGKHAELQEYKRRKNEALATTALGAALIAGSTIVTNNPAITNEMLQFMAGTVQSVMPVIGTFLGIDVLGYAINQKRYNDLAKELGIKKTNKEESEEEGLKR